LTAGIAIFAIGGLSIFVCKAAANFVSTIEPFQKSYFVAVGGFGSV